MLFFELSPFGKQLSSANRHGTQPEKKKGKAETNRIQMSDVGFLMSETGRMIGIYSKNCEVKF